MTCFYTWLQCRPIIESEEETTSSTTPIKTTSLKPIETIPPDPSSNFYWKQLLRNLGWKVIFVIFFILTIALGILSFGCFSDKEEKYQTIKI